MNRKLLLLGFILFFIAFVTGLVIPLFTNPHLGVSAHLNAIFGGIILAIIAIVQPILNLSAKSLKIMNWTWVYAVYMNWLATLLGAIWGTSRLTPVAGAGFKASALLENIMTILLGSLVLTSFIGCVIAIWGLRGQEKTV